MSSRRLIGVSRCSSSAGSSDGRGGGNGGSSGGCSYCGGVGNSNSGGLVASECIFKSELLFLGRL